MAFATASPKAANAACVPYTLAASGLIGRSSTTPAWRRHNASANVGRTQQAIDKYHPAFSDHPLRRKRRHHSGDATGGIAAALAQWCVHTASIDNVVPVLNDLSEPILGHNLFAGGTISLNRSIRALASSEGIKCVDLEREFSAGPDPIYPEWPMTDATLMGPDGLHPNDAGTQVIALSCADLF
jgi:hypothetical protein